MATFRLYESPWEEEFFKIEGVGFFFFNFKDKKWIFSLLNNSFIVKNKI